MNLDHSSPDREEIQQMIYELAKGNFSYRIPLSTADRDHMEIAVLLNLLAEELNRFFIHPGLFGEKDLENPFVFVIDTRYTLCGANPSFSHLLGEPEAELIGQSIQHYLVPSSFKNLQQQLDGFASSETSRSSVKLLLQFRLFPSHYIDSWGYCHALSGPTETYYFIRGSKLMTKHSEYIAPSALPPPNFSYLQYRSDIERIRAVNRYILAHLHESLPHIHELARNFHLNEFKLKKGFKDLYQTTIFRFHRDNRLDQAFVMVQHTPSSLKVIADSLGFKSFPHFSKVFKDKFGYSPSHYR